MGEGPLGGPRPLGMGPLAKSRRGAELEFETAFAVTDQYGRSLENDDFRENEENKIRQLLASETSMSRGDARGTRVDLGPAGNIAGCRFGLSGTTIQGTETRDSIISIPELVDVVEAARNRIDGITGFRIPTAYSVGYAEMTDEPMWAINLKE